LIYSEDNKSKSWTQNIILKKLQKKYTHDLKWQNISNMIYLSLNHELRAKIQEIETELRLAGPDNFLEFLINTKTYNDFKQISLLKSDIVLNILMQDKNHKEIIRDFNNDFLNKKNNYDINFMKYFDHIIKNAEYMLYKIKKISYLQENFLYNTGHNFNINFDDFKKNE